jgi:hypothetical protein
MARGRLRADDGGLRNVQVRAKRSTTPDTPWRPATPTIPQYRRLYRGLARSKPRGARSEHRAEAAVSIVDRSGQTIHEAEKKRRFRFRWGSGGSVDRHPRSTFGISYATPERTRSGVRRRRRTRSASVRGTYSPAVDCRSQGDTRQGRHIERSRSATHADDAPRAGKTSHTACP